MNKAYFQPSIILVEDKENEKGRVSRESIEGEYRGRVSRESIEGEYRGRVSRESIEGEYRGRVSRERIATDLNGIDINKSTSPWHRIRVASPACEPYITAHRLDGVGSL